MSRICPIQTAVKETHYVDCDEDACAWYDEADKQCAVLAISRHLHDITYRLADLNLDGMTIEKEE